MNSKHLNFVMQNFNLQCLWQTETGEIQIYVDKMEYNNNNIMKLNNT